MNASGEHPATKDCLTYKVFSCDKYWCLQNKELAITCKFADTNGIAIYCHHPACESLPNYEASWNPWLRELPLWAGRQRHSPPTAVRPSLSPFQGTLLRFIRFHCLPVGMGTVPGDSVGDFVIMVMSDHGNGEIFLPDDILVVDFQRNEIIANVLHPARSWIGTEIWCRHIQIPPCQQHSINQVKA